MIGEKGQAAAPVTQTRSPRESFAQDGAPKRYRRRVDANEQMGQLLVDVPEYQSVFESVLPTPFVEVIEISEAMVCLCARSGRYVTGITPTGRRLLHRRAVGHSRGWFSTLSGITT
jgi:hypothetical protein